MVLRIFESHESSGKNMNSVSNSLRNEFRGQHTNLSMNSTANSLVAKNMNFILPFLFPSKKCGGKKQKKLSKSTIHHEKTLRETSKYWNPKRKNNEPHGLLSRNTEKHTLTLFFYKIQRKTQTPRLVPYSFPPPPFLLGILIFNYPSDLKIFCG
jgi:hypothetical protein